MIKFAVNHRKDIACTLAIVVLAVLFMGESLLPDKMLAPLDIVMGLRPWSKTDYQVSDVYNTLPSDKVFYIHPIKVLVGRAWRTGLPLWEPRLLSGYPIVGNAQAGIFYPGILPYIFLTGADASDLVALFHLVVAGLGVYVYLRAIKCKHLAALLGGIVFMLNGVLGVWLMWDSVAGAMVWLPWALFGFELTLRPGRFWTVAIGALAIGLSYLGGHLQWAVYAVLAMALYSLFRFIWSQTISRRRILLTALLIGGAGTALAALQILPSLEYIRAGHRGYMPFEIIQQARDWASFLTLWVPKFFGEVLPPRYWGPINYNEALIYVGIAPLLLALIALARRRDARVIFFAGLGILGVLFAAGTDAYRVLHWLPGFDSWMPTRMRYWVVISLSILAALGLDSLLRSTEQRSPKMLARMMLFPAGLGLTYLIARAGNLPTQPYQLEFLSRQEVLFVELLAAATALLILYSLSRRWGQMALAGLCVLALIDLWLPSETYQRPISTEYDYPVTPGIQLMMDDADRFRVLSVRSPDWFKWELRPNLPPLFGLQDVGGYDSVYLQRYANYLQHIDPAGPPSTSSNYLEPSRFDSPLVDLLNVKYALSADKVQAPGWEVAYKDDLRIYRRTQVVPRAWIAAQAEVVSDDNAILERLTAPSFDPYKTVILEKTPVESLGVDDTTPAGTVNIEQYENTRLTLTAQLEHPGWLALSEIFYPGWHVTVDGVPANLYRANYIFRAVPIAAGSHRIEMWFLPDSFVIGACISLASLSGLILLPIVAWRRARRSASNSMTS